MDRGISRIYDAIVACTIYLVGCSALISMVPAYQTARSDDLGALASHTLSYLDKGHALGNIVYSKDSKAALSTLGSLLPPHLGYRLEVFNTNWSLLWSVESGYGFDSGSASYYLAGHNGSYMPLIAVLRISR